MLILDSIKMEFKSIVFILVGAVALAAVGAFNVINNIMPNGEYFIGVSTLFLGMVTFALVYTEISEGKKRRQIERLRERLEGLYSPLMGLGDFEFVYDHLNVERYNYLMMKDLRKVYSYLASDALRNQLDIYYSHVDAGRDELNETELKNLETQFKADYEEITKEYRELTLSDFEEKRRTEITKSMSKILLPK